MAGHPPAPASQTEENVGDYPQDNQSSQTYDDKLAADLYKDYSSQNELFKQIIVALAAGGISYGSEVINAYNFLKNPLDAEKLVKDPAYKKEVERAVQLIKRHEGGKITDGRSKYKDIVPQAQRVIERTNGAHNKLVAEKSAMLLNENLYLRHLQSSYNLDDKQLQALTYSAMKQIRENPSLSIKDALRMEAEKFSLKQAIKDVEKENKGKKLTKEEKKSLVDKKLAEKHIVFETSLTTTRIDKNTGEPIQGSYADYENNRVKKIIEAQIEENKQILAAKAQPTPSPQPAPAVSTAPPPVSVPPAPPRVVMPPSRVPSIPTIAFPAGLSQGLGRLGTFFGGLGGGFGAQVGSFLGNGARSLLGSGGLLSRGLSAGLNLAKTALPRLASFAIPPLGAALTTITAVDALTGGLITKGAALAVGAVAAIVIVIPIIIGVGVFSYVTGNNSLKISYTNEKTIGWNEFNKKFLTIDNNNQLSWQRFEKENLTLNKNYLSLNTDGHDDMKK